MKKMTVGTAINRVTNQHFMPPGFRAMLAAGGVLDETEVPLDVGNLISTALFRIDETNAAVTALAIIGAVQSVRAVLRHELA